MSTYVRNLLAFMALASTLYVGLGIFTTKAVGAEPMSDSEYNLTVAREGQLLQGAKPVTVDESRFVTDHADIIKAIRIAKVTGGNSGAVTRCCPRCKAKPGGPCISHLASD